MVDQTHERAARDWPTPDEKTSGSEGTGELFLSSLNPKMKRKKRNASVELNSPN